MSEDQFSQSPFVVCVVVVNGSISPASLRRHRHSLWRTLARTRRDNGTARELVCSRTIKTSATPVVGKFSEKHSDYPPQNDCKVHRWEYSQGEYLLYRQRVVALQIPSDRFLLHCNHRNAYQNQAQNRQQ